MIIDKPFVNFAKKRGGRFSKKLTRLPLQIVGAGINREGRNPKIIRNCLCLLEHPWYRTNHTYKKIRQILYFHFNTNKS